MSISIAKLFRRIFKFSTGNYWVFLTNTNKRNIMYMSLTFMNDSKFINTGKNVGLGIKGVKA